MLERFAKWLYVKYGKPDLIALTREQLGLYTAKVDLAAMSPEQLSVMAVEAKEMRNSDIYKFVQNLTLQGLRDHIIEQATDQQLIYDRLSINGVYLFDENIELIESYKPQKVDFDKHSIF